jgi:hypothetical protein
VKGWQRAGALVGLFTREEGGFSAPTELIAPRYDRPSKRRAWETLLPLSEALGLKIVKKKYAPEDAKPLGEALCKVKTGVTLVCWEHEKIHKIAKPIAPDAQIPANWPDNRFDMVWRFAWDPHDGKYGFSQIPQMLLHGDKPTVIAP